MCLVRKRRGADADAAIHVEASASCPPALRQAQALLEIGHGHGTRRWQQHRTTLFALAQVVCLRRSFCPLLCLRPLILHLAHVHVHVLVHVGQCRAPLAPRRDAAG